MMEPDSEPPEIGETASSKTEISETEISETFDRERVLTLLNRLERDIAIVEAAMAHVEAGEHESYAAAMTVLEPHLD